MLNEALATEIVCVLRYKRHYFMAQGIDSDSVKAEFASTRPRSRSMRTDRGADRPARRRARLNPDTLTKRSHAEYVEGKSLVDMLARGSGRGADRDRQLPRNRGVAARQGFDHPSG